MAASAQIKKVNPWHEKLAAYMLLHGDSPGWQARASKEFNVSQSWLSTVIHSDIFQDYYLRLREETTPPIIQDARSRMLGTLDHAITLVQQKLESDGPTLPLSNILEAVDILAKRTGHSERTTDTPIIQNQVLVVSREDLEESRKRMRRGSLNTPATPLQILDASLPSAASSQTTEGDL